MQHLCCTPSGTVLGARAAAFPLLPLMPHLPPTCLRVFRCGTAAPSLLPPHAPCLHLPRVPRFAGPWQNNVADAADADCGHNAAPATHTVPHPNVLHATSYVTATRVFFDAFTIPNSLSRVSRNIIIYALVCGAGAAGRFSSLFYHLSYRLSLSMPPPSLSHCF